MLVGKTFLLNFMCSMFSSLCNTNFFRSPHVQNDRRNDGALNVDHNPVVETKSGKVMGYLMSSSEGRIIRAFEGIPFAQPPVNHLRFQRPLPVKPWRNVVKATKLPPVCLQVNPAQFFRVVGVEDCLYLSIYTPIPETKKNSSRLNEKAGKGQNAKKNLLPVVIFVHGGGFSFGYSGDYGPFYLLNSDVIFVTFNYRLGILGFLSTGTDSCPGNNGLMDQSLAIKWIVDNIEFFGGDPNNIILMGQSAGAVSTHLQMLSKQSQSYIKAAISISGTAFVHWAIQTPEKAARLRNKMADIVGCQTQNPEEQLQCFKQQNPVFLVASQLNLEEWLPFPPILFAPVVEQNSTSRSISNSSSDSSSFLVQSPEEIYRSKQVAPIPWITSVTSQEGYIFLLFLKALLRLQSFRQDWESLQPLALSYKYFGTDDPHKTTRRIKDFYFGNRSPSEVSLNELSDVLSDRYFTFGFVKGLEAHSKVAKTYGYIWKYKGKYNIANAIGVPSSKWGVGHGEDLFYMLNSSSSYNSFQRDEPEYKLSKIVLNLLNNFFYTREPLYDLANGTKVPVWDPVQEVAHANVSSLKILQVDHDIQMIENPHEEKFNFWLSLNLSDSQPLTSTSAAD